VTGTLPWPNGSASYRKKIGGRQIFDASYHFDGHSRRVAAIEGDGRERFLLFLGGSRTFGQGVSEDETIPYSVGRQLDDYRPYSYGYHVSGPA